MQEEDHELLSNEDDELDLRDDELDLTETILENEAEELEKEADEEQEDKEQEEPEDEGSKPLYAGAPVTLVESMLLVLVYAMKHQLTGVALTDLLVLISLHCMIPNVCKTSLYLFNKFFKNITTSLKLHRFCSKCYYLLEDEEVQICPICQRSLSSRSSVSYFIEIPLIEQLRDMFLRENFYDDLQYRFNRRKKNGENIEDIYDGKLYKEFSKEGGFLSSPNNISLFWYTDGIPLFKSSSMSLWPLFFTVNELPYKKRTLKENVLIAGLWFGDSKPCMGTFLKPFNQTLEELKDGFDVQLSDGSNKRVKAMLIGGTCDMPAKSQVLNMIQFNGAFGCPKCLQPGKTVPSGAGHTHVYPYMMDNPNGPKRTIDGFREAADTAYESGQRVDGINGPSWFLYHMDVVRGTAQDYMHQVFLGIARKLTHLWFDSSYHLLAFSLSKRLKDVNARLLNIKPPNFISRAPASIFKLKFWKASEFRSWLFYYSAAVLFNILPSIYFQHHLLLVETIYTLTSESISPESLDKCEVMLNYYVCMFSVLYGEAHMGINIHSLVHLTDTVKDLGPLFVFSCFPYESLNGDLKVLFHGTQSIDKQIASAVSKLLKLPTLISKIDQSSPVGTFLSSLRGCAGTTGICVGDNKILGSMKQKTLDRLQMRALGTCADIIDNRAMTFLRFCRGPKVFSCLLYQRQFVRNSSVVVFSHHESLCYGQVQFYIKYPMCVCISMPCICSKYYAILKMFEETDDVKLLEDSGPTQATLYHIKVCKRLSPNANLIVVPISNIIDVCVFMEFLDQDVVFISQAPNQLESD